MRGPADLVGHQPGSISCCGEPPSHGSNLLSDQVFFDPPPPPMPAGGLVPPSGRRIRRGSVVAAVAGALMVVGAVLPWFELSAGGEDLVSVTGSIRPLLAGVIVIICMLLSLVSGSVRLFAVPAIASLASTASATIDYFRLRDAIADLPPGLSGSIGAGIFVCIVGSVIAAVASVAAAVE